MVEMDTNVKIRKLENLFINKKNYKLFVTLSMKVKMWKRFTWGKSI